MNIKIIINSFIIIFILHIILININYSYTIGKKNELFTNSDKENNKKNSLDFLMNDNVEPNEDFKKKLSNYIQQSNKSNDNTNFDNKNINTILPSNSFLSDKNVPNFESNVANIDKFYKINYDNLNENELNEIQSTSIESLKNSTTVIDKKDIEPCKDTEYIRNSTVSPDTWEYKNELPMNGGKMNGIFGFDSLESQFAIYNPNKLNLQESTSNNFIDLPHEDLRKPVLYEN